MHSCLCRSGITRVALLLLRLCLLLLSASTQHAHQSKGPQSVTSGLGHEGSHLAHTCSSSSSPT